MSIYSSIGSENFQKSLAPSMVKISKKQDRTYSTELHSLFAKHIFNFRFRYFQLPVSEKQPTSGFEVPTGSRKVPHAIDQVELYTPQKFHANRFSRLGGDRFTHIKKTASNLSNLYKIVLIPLIYRYRRIFPEFLMMTYVPMFIPFCQFANI